MDPVSFKNDHTGHSGERFRPLPGDPGFSKMKSVQQNFPCKSSKPMIDLYTVLNRCRHGGMADASDSKSDGGNLVPVQVRLPALPEKGAVRRENLLCTAPFSYPLYIFVLFYDQPEGLRSRNHPSRAGSRSDGFFRYMTASHIPLQGGFQGSLQGNEQIPGQLFL